MQDETQNEESIIVQDRDLALNSIAELIAKDRSEAISWRSSEGIERIWLQDEEAYEGIDDQNRFDPSSTPRPPEQADARHENSRPRSNLFYNITRPYCDTGAARIGDMLVPTDDRNFLLKPTTIPDLVNISKGNIPQSINGQIKESISGMQQIDPNINPEEKAKTIQNELIDDAKNTVEEAREKANKAQARIDDWLIEGDFNSQVRLCIEDAAKVGTGILKGPVPAMVTAIAYVNGELIEKDDIKPESYRVSYWNVFPDPGCGNNIHNGSFIFEKDEITPKELYSLASDPGYFDDQIIAVLKEGPYSATKRFIKEYETLEDSGLSKRKTENLFEIWYYYGAITSDRLEKIGFELEADDGYMINVQLTMVNNRVVKCTRSHMGNGELPYDFMVWQEAKGSPFGIGISRQIRDAQRGLNAALRMMMDNAGAAGGPMWAYRQGVIEPIEGNPGISPFKGWVAGDDAMSMDLSKAFTFFTVPMLQGEINNIINLHLKMAEDSTGLPLILQGQQGSSPETVGGMILMHSNASTMLRRIARLFDSVFYMRHIRRYYRYLLSWGEDSEKGDFEVEVRGSTALIEKDIHNQALMNIGSFVQNPVFKKDPAKWIDQVLRSQRIDPKSLDYDDDQWQQIVQQLSQPPQDSSAQIAQMKIEHDAQQKQADRDLEAAKLQSKQQSDEMGRQLKAALAEFEAENKARIEQGKAELTMRELETRLTETVMKLDVQSRLSMENSYPGTKQVILPPIEPAGRAPNGQAFQK